MRRLGPAVFFFLFLAGPMTQGCEREEYSLLLKVTVDAYVDELEVQVRSLDRAGGSEIERRMIARDADMIAEEPLQVAITLPGPMPVAVRLVSREVGGRATHSAFRCYQVDAVVRDTFSLVPISVADNDGDGWPSDLAAGCGEGCPSLACPAAFADCNDTDSSINPGANETCGADFNCDGMTEECPDVDMDGYRACPPGTVDGTCDCNDNDPSFNPGIDEGCPSTADFNCDGREGALCDRDDDGFVASVETGGVPDCDDTNPDINPDAMEDCDTPADDNCDGAINEGCSPDDLDADGFLPADGDCNDCDPASYPGAPERCMDGVDQDCNMMDLMCQDGDADHDGVRALASGGRDCDDTRADIYPDAPEYCDGSVDEDCDGSVDEGCPDPDRDGWVEIGGYIVCEGDPARNPGVMETCDGTDEDCDGVVDEDAALDGSACIRTLAGGTEVVDFSTDMRHCGGCGMACPSLRTDQCVDGVCKCSTNGRDELPCDGGLVCCNGGGSASGCRDFSADFDNCGACGNACERERADACVDGNCVCGTGLPCGGSLSCCGGRCVDSVDRSQQLQSVWVSVRHGRAVRRRPLSLLRRRDGDRPEQGRVQDDGRVLCARPHLP